MKRECELRKQTLRKRITKATAAFEASEAAAQVANAAADAAAREATNLEAEVAELKAQNDESRRQNKELLMEQKKWQDKVRRGRACGVAVVAMWSARDSMCVPGDCLRQMLPTQRMWRLCTSGEGG